MPDILEVSCAADQGFRNRPYKLNVPITSSVARYNLGNCWFCRTCDLPARAADAIQTSRITLLRDLERSSREQRLWSGWRPIAAVPMSRSISRRVRALIESVVVLLCARVSKRQNPRPSLSHCKRSSAFRAGKKLLRLGGALSNNLSARSLGMVERLIPNSEQCALCRSGRAKAAAA
jgi:hypothetical protein